ncbi:MAG: hypothetical protein JXC36_03565 [Candidatus Atribacteria bacterium]|nr:hypothetical protein [Candidatus Atribacteria bacterium]
MLKIESKQELMTYPRKVIFCVGYGGVNSIIKYKDTLIKEVKIKYIYREKKSLFAGFEFYVIRFNFLDF